MRAAIDDICAGFVPESLACPTWQANDTLDENLESVLRFDPTINQVPAHNVSPPS